VLQTRGPAMLNDRSPIAVRDLRTSSRAALAERMPVRRWPAYCRSLDRYTGARPFRHLWTMLATLNVIRWRTGNQWSDRSVKYCHMCQAALLHIFCYFFNWLHQVGSMSKHQEVTCAAL